MLFANVVIESDDIIEQECQVGSHKVVWVIASCSVISQLCAARFVIPNLLTSCENFAPAAPSKGFGLALLARLSVCWFGDGRIMQILGGVILCPKCTVQPVLCNLNTRGITVFSR